MQAAGALSYPPFPLFSVIPAPAFICHSGESRNPAQIERGTRTLQRRTALPLPSRDISAKEREARAFYAGFRLSPE